jgi:phenylacetic acid degradation protein
MVVGSPARVIRDVTEKEVAWKTRGTAEYQQLARDCLAGLKPVEPLKAVETDRPHMAASDVVSIQEARQKPS